MKIYSYKLSLAVIAIVAIGLAFGNSLQAQTIIDTTAATGIGTSIDAAPAVNPATVREKIRATTQVKVQNVKNNQEIRNELVASSTKARVTNIKEKADDRIENIKEKTDNRIMTIKERAEEKSRLTSTTRPLMEKERERVKERAQEYREDGKAMIINAFKVRKGVIVKQLQVALNNLIQVRDRINSRIQKEQQINNATSTPTEKNRPKRNMTEAIRLLAIADTKIASAKDAIKLVMDYTPNASTTATIQINTGSSQNSTGQQTINLDEARQLINNAHVAIKEARKALNDVIVAIAKAMGLKLGQTASTTSNASIEVR